MMKPAGGLRSLGGWEGHALPRQKRRGRAAEACRAASRPGGGTGLLSSSCRDRSARPLGLRSLSADRGSQYVEDNGDGEGAGRQEEVVAGSSAGLVSSLTLQPFEVVKTRMQAGRLDCEGCTFQGCQGRCCWHQAHLDERVQDVGNLCMYV